MLREEAIEYIHKLYMMADITDEYGDMDDTEPYETAIDMAVEALKFRGAYEIAVKAANKAFEDRKTQWVEWIPCSERLPKQQQPVIVTDEGDVLTGYVNSLNEWMDFHGNRLKGVTAWMPLPKPYQEDN